MHCCSLAREPVLVGRGEAGCQKCRVGARECVKLTLDGLVYCPLG